MKIVIGWLYPTLMSTYGDRGNVICLQRRCQWRDIKVEILPFRRESEATELAQADIIVGGGAQDRQQEIVMRDLQGAKADMLRAKLDGGTPGVFTCGSPQLLGHYYEPGEGKRIKGLGLLNMVSKHPGIEAQRCIGNLAFEITATPIAQELEIMLGEKPIVVGFENHGGRTYLQNVQPLGRVVKGYGNNGEDRTAGAFYQNAIATYAHGPLLPKNQFIADWLIKKALQQKYATEINLAPLDDSLAVAGRKSMLQKMGISTASVAV